MAFSRWGLLGVVLVSGASVMLIEILGTRIIGPVFGVSLFVWAALLSVTLCALAIGYYAGGVLIDRAPRGALLGWVLALAGVALGAVPIVQAPVLSAVSDWGPRAGPLLAALVLFAPSLAALGMTGPIAVRLATTELATAGRRVGSIYAMSTAGSLAGTMATSFWLIPEYETGHIVAGTALFLTLLGSAVLIRRRRAWASVSVLVPLLGMRSEPPQLPANYQLRAATSSPYGLVEVIDDTSRGVRYLRADHSIIGAHWLRDHSSAFAFLHALEALALLRPSAQDLLVIGLGTGALPTALAKRGIRSDVIEIDPAVARYARDYFNFQPTGSTHLEDARTFIGRSARRYDLIVHDTFTGGSTPDHLLSAEVLRQLRQLLRPGGLLALNMVGFQRGPSAAATWAVARTLRQEFPIVRAYRDSPPERRSDAATNILFFASDAAIDLTVPSGFRFSDSICAEVIPAMRSWEILESIPPGDVITDEHNPLGRLQLAVAEQHYSAMNELMPLPVWVR